MNILSIDTTTKEASVSILYNDNIITKSISNEVTHSEKLLPLIDDVLENNNLKLKDIDMYACINGPGSFTGIRIGLSTLKAFSFIDNKNIFSMSSLDLLSFVAYKNSKYFKEGNNAIVISLIDARNDRVYYSINNLSISNNKIDINYIENNSNSNISDLFFNISNEYNNVIVCGDSVNKYSDIITEKFPNAILSDFYPKTSDLINAYFEITSPNNYTFDTYTLDANYVRPSQAERMLNNE